MEKKGGRETVEDECLGDNIHYAEIDCPPKTYPSFPTRVPPSTPRRHHPCRATVLYISCSIQHRTELKSLGIGIYIIIIYCWAAGIYLI